MSAYEIIFSIYKKLIMETATQKTKALNGGEWLIKETHHMDIFIEEDFSEEQKMIEDMAHQFIDMEVYPVINRLEKMEPGLMPALLEKAGEAGLLSASVPEQYGGLGKDLITSTIINANFGRGYSFCVAFTAQ